MLQRARKHINPATILAFVALIFALTGGAFAATGGGGGSHATLTASVAKKKSKAPARGPAGPKGATGATGTAGPAGPAGAAGAKGENGAAGSNGTDGKEGEKGTNGTNGTKGRGVTSETLSPGDANCPAGGSKFTASGSETYACTGAEGKEGKEGKEGVIHPGTKLPPEATETGTWSVSANASGIWYTPISFPIPLAEPVESPECAHKIPGPECHAPVVLVLVQEGKIGAEPGELCEGKSGEEQTECEESYKLIQQKCPSTAEAPTAMPGNLCIYISKIENTYTGEFIHNDPANGSESDVGTTGLMLGVDVTGSEATDWGTWAVTAAKAS